ncbi:hypothetical protein HMPREF1370_02423 [Enterococcus faecium P1123]|nr:hypothetical protein HMPREF1370_02423 [Enterococcus faecium P1123]EJX97320.1 hypothetical protein HMPREF1363_02976 [Enterococcus faecium ERV161]
MTQTHGIRSRSSRNGEDAQEIVSCAAVHVDTCEDVDLWINRAFTVFY